MLDLFNQPGYPILSISSTYSQHSPMNSTWNIPMFLYDLNTQQERVYWLLRDGGICPPNSSNFKKNLIFNHQAKGFYHVNYSTDLLGEILQTNLSQLD